MSTNTDREIDTGTAYGMEPATYIKELIEVGPGTPMGELMRRYWQPFALSADLTSDKPRRVRLLGEDLIFFRDKSGRPGLVHEHCTHRGTSLYYGRIEEDGIRCCYHGWKFDVKGHCIDQPCEVNRGEANRHRVRQPWYPVEERYGLVYAYMGPPEKKPVLPRWKYFEDIAEDEYVEAAAVPVGPMTGYYNNQDFNWLQSFENGMDGPHLPWLHYHHSCDQFAGVSAMNRTPDDVPAYADLTDFMERVIGGPTPHGLKQSLLPPGMPPGIKTNRWSEAIVPNILVVATLLDMLYFVPVDDTNFLTFSLFRTKKGQRRSDITEQHVGKTWWDMTEEEHQAEPGDYEAQSSIGRLPAHSREHLSPGDRGVVQLRRILQDAVATVANGGDPPGVSFDEASAEILPESHREMHYATAEA